MQAAAVYMLEILRRHNLESCSAIRATGGGAFKHADWLKCRYGLVIANNDEMDCLIKGLDFLTCNLQHASFFMGPEDAICFEDPVVTQYPCLLVNIGSGVSIVKVSSATQYERISGSCIGGGTFWGLMSMLCQAGDYNDALSLIHTGNNKSVDFLVGDIYGDAYAKVGLDSELIASSFGKASKMSDAERMALMTANSGNADIGKSLLCAVCFNVAQLACLNAQLHGINRIYFSGFFTRGHFVTMKTLTFALNYWSRGSMKGFFLRHEGYLGALGALLSPSLSNISPQASDNCLSQASAYSIESQPHPFVEHAAPSIVFSWKE